MALPGQRSDPIRGVKGGKTRILRTTPRKRLGKLPATPEAADLAELSSIYLRERNAQMRAKRLKAEMELALQRDELIEKRLASLQASHLLIGLRQAMLALPGKMRARFGDERFNHEMLESCRSLVAETLEHASRLPESVDPGWLEKLEEEG
jgi:uncharacterized membrane protein YccC